ncbi:MAG: sugar ABC transporter substrate-binding protein [Trebonia sp.]
MAAVATAGGALALVLAGCASSASSGGSASTSTSTSTSVGADATSSAGANAGLAHAQAQIAKYSGVVDSYLPTEKLSDPAKLVGKKVMYIPAVATVPFFQVSWSGIKSAFAAVGVNASICDAQANPATMAACLNQAVNEGYSGVIIDSITPDTAQQAYDKVVSAGIPIVLGTLSLPAGSPSNLVAVGPEVNLPVQLEADAIIAKSGGNANIVGVEITDSTSTTSRYQGGVKELSTYCAACKLTTVQIKSPQMQQLPSQVSAALLANPGVSYLMPEFSNIADTSAQGATDAGKGTLPLSTAATALSDLQELAAGKSLFSTVGWDVVRTAWNEADVLDRLMLHQKVDATKYLSPVRVFNSSNVKSLDISQAGWGDSNWFGGDGYQATYRALWK